MHQARRLSLQQRLKRLTLANWTRMRLKIREKENPRDRRIESLQFNFYLQFSNYKFKNNETKF